MKGSSLFLRFIAPGIVALAAFAVGGCSNMNSSTLTPNQQVSAAVTQVYTLPASGGSIPVNSGNQVSSLQIAAGAPVVAITVVGATAAPTNAPLPSAKDRAPEQAASASPSPSASPTAIPGAVVPYYVTLVVSANVPGSAFSGATLTLNGSEPGNALYYLEVDDISSAPASRLGTFAGTVAGGVVTYSTSGLGAFMPQHTYLYQYFYLPQVASFSPAPTKT
jgi:hypothetical protein